MPGVELKVDWCSHKAALYACENWHYSKVLPVGKLVKVGVWESGEFIGAVLFGRGANKNMLKPYKLDMTEGCELVRVALSDHSATVSRIVKIALIFLKKSNKSLKLVVSYADLNQGHIGGIYQAGNWICDGFSPGDSLIVNGKPIHKKSLYSKYGHSSIEKLKALGLKVERDKGGGKHRYIMPLDKATRKKVAPLAKPYPKRAK